MQERIQKLISAAGLMSRRAAETLITDGRVKINGHTATIGEKADPRRTPYLWTASCCPSPEIRFT